MPTTTDNNLGSLILDAESTRSLLPLSGKTLTELCAGHPGLIVFPAEGSSPDGADSLPLFHIDPKSRTLTTGNLMGFIGTDSCRLDILSRFSSPAGADNFLYHMLARVFCPTVVNLPHESTTRRGPDILTFLFPGLLEEALRQGVYKEYNAEERNDSLLRGRVDIGRHLRLNIPFAGNVAYTSRALAFDNRVTRLVRHTVGHLRSSALGRAVLSSDISLVRAIDTIVEATPGFSPGALRRDIALNLARPVDNPCFSAYKPLQELCLMILGREMLRSGARGRQIHGILFDGAWLWEEYTAGILRPMGFSHSRNKEGAGALPLFTNGRYRRFIDFHRPGIVADAKYKRLGPDKLDRDDLHQLVCYIHMQKAANGLFIHPSTETRLTPIGELRGHGGRVWLLSIKVPEAASYTAFAEAMTRSEDEARALVEKLL